MKELADSIKRLRNSVDFWSKAKGITTEATNAALADDAKEAIQTINQLVELVAEMHKSRLGTFVSLRAAKNSAERNASI